MALQVNTSLKNNFGETSSFSNSYVKVVRISGDKTSLSAEVHWYKSKDEIKIKECSYTFDVSLSGANFIQQSYQHLKTLPEFEGATDV